MNKRFIAFLNELAEENQRLENQLETRLVYLDRFDRDLKSANAEIKRLKRLLRERKVK